MNWPLNTKFNWTRWEDGTLRWQVIRPISLVLYDYPKFLDAAKQFMLCIFCSARIENEERESSAKFFAQHPFLHDNGKVWDSKLKRIVNTKD